MTIQDDTGSWGALLTELDAGEVEAVIARTKAWLLRSGGVMAVTQAERVGDMVVLSGVDYRSGLPCAASVPASELVSRAA